MSSANRVRPPIESNVPLVAEHDGAVGHEHETSTTTLSELLRSLI
jgi:hypothetical protein